MIHNMLDGIGPAFYVWRPRNPPDFVYDFIERCALLCRNTGFRESTNGAASAFAIAPCLRRKLSLEEFSAPNWGTLIFHPSILPLHRGPDAIKWAMHNREPLSGVTWFWATEDLDAGDIAGQAPVIIDTAVSARRNFVERFAPAGLNALAALLTHWKVHRSWPRIPQDQRFATVEGRFVSDRAA